MWGLVSGAETLEDLEAIENITVCSNMYSGTPLIWTSMDQMSEVSSISEVKIVVENVSCLERCPQFRGVLVDGFHRTCMHYVDCTFSGSLVAVLRGKAESSSGVYLEQE